jgi:hypothetical protein
MKENKPVYVLRTCNEDLTSYNGFQWPSYGYVEAPDWDPEPIFGKGLHGLLWGSGAGVALDWSPNAKWVVVRVDGGVVGLNGMVKFKSGYVEFCGDRKAATDFIIEKGADPANVAGAIIAVADNQTAVVGYGGFATAGFGGVAKAGFYGFATAGLGGSVSAGWRGMVSIVYADYEEGRYRLKTGYIGENGLLPNVLYKLNEENDFIPVENEVNNG